MRIKRIREYGLLLLAASLWSGALRAQEPVVIRGGTLVDVRDGSLTPDVEVVVAGDRIVSVSAGAAQSAQSGTVIDARGKFIVPGLIDLHVHYRDWSAELYMNHGVTTVVDLGTPHEWVKAQKDGIDRGVLPGPRLFYGTMKPGRAAGRKLLPARIRAHPGRPGRRDHRDAAVCVGRRKGRQGV